MTLSRRRFLLASAIGSAGAACNGFNARESDSLGGVRRVSAWRAPGSESSSALRAATLDGLPRAHDAFPLGASSGDATSNAAVVWTRFRGDAPLILWVERVPPGGAPSVVLQDVLEPDADGFVHRDVNGLEPGTTYRYAWLTRDRHGSLVRGPDGRFRTAPDDDAMPVVTFAGTSCTNQVLAPFPALDVASRIPDLDFFIHGGDNVYADFAHDLGEYRSRYAEAWPAFGMAGLHASVGHYVTWDDHEVGNNWNPETIDRGRLATAKRAFLEHQPIRRDASAPTRIWRSFRWGRTLELFVLDCRGERKPSTRSRSDAEYLSPPQLAWLLEGLRTSRARYRFVLNSVPITNFPGLFDALASDRWEGYPAQRSLVLETLVRERIPNVWWLSGDFHFGAITHIEPIGPYASMREVLMGPGRQLPNMLAGSLNGPQWDFVTNENNVTVFRVDPHEGAVEVRFVGEDGRVRFSRRYADDA